MCCSGQDALVPMREGVSGKTGPPSKRRIVSMGNHIRKNNGIILIKSDIRGLYILTDIDLLKNQHSVGSGMHEMTIKRRVIHWIRHNLYFFFFGVLCIVWFLFRTGTKPSRIEYPCQQASVAGANLWMAVYLLPLVSMIRSNGNGRRQTARLLGAGIIVVFLAIGALYYSGGLNLLPIPDGQSQSITEAGITEKNNLTNVTSDIFVVNGTSGNDGGIYQLLSLMERKGTPFFATGNGTDKAGLIAKNDVVIIKVNGQWNQRGGTNTDLVRSLIQAIVDHPDGFTGEIIIADNGQAQYGATQTGGNLTTHRIMQKTSPSQWSV